MTDPSGAVQIRPLVADDESQWRELWHDYLAYYETELPEKNYQVAFERLLGDDPSGFKGLVATDGATLLGLTHFVFHPHLWKIENTCYLQDLYARPETRGRGIGRALIEAVYAAADQAGCPSVYWLTQDFNHTARRLYDRVGTLTPFLKYARPA